jgi:hypothetical protein
VRKLLGVAALYALGGALTPYLWDWADRFLKTWTLNSFDVSRDALTPLAFALLSAVFFLRSWRAVLSVPLNWAAWLGAYHIALQMEQSGGPYFGKTFFEMCLAGFAGGLGVALADSICHRKLVAPKNLSGAALIGTLAALPFGFWFHGYQAPWHAPCSFAIWQASVGTYLYYVCTDGRKSAEMTDSPQR